MLKDEVQAIRGYTIVEMTYGSKVSTPAFRLVDEGESKEPVLVGINVRA